MRQFDYLEKWKSLLTPEIVLLLTQIHEYKGEQTLLIEAKADALTQLVETKPLIKLREFILRMSGCALWSGIKRGREQEMSRRSQDTGMY